MKNHLNWDKRKNEILIADVDPEVNEPYWVKTKEIFKSISHCHPTNNLPRGCHPAQNTASGDC